VLADSVFSMSLIVAQGMLLSQQSALGTSRQAHMTLTPTVPLLHAQQLCICQTNPSPASAF